MTHVDALFDQLTGLRDDSRSCEACFVGDAERLVMLPDHARVLRILNEIDEPDHDVAHQVAENFAVLLASRPGCKKEDHPE